MIDAPYLIVLVVEGDEEETFFRMVKEKGVSDCISLNIINANGYGNVGALYQEFVSHEEIDLVMAVYDVDNASNNKDSPFNRIRRDLFLVLGDECSVDAISLCTNPNILQLFLLGCDELQKVSLTTSSKDANTHIINKYWPSIGKDKPYRAHKWQLEIMLYSYLNEEYTFENLLTSLSKISTDYKRTIPSSNLYLLLKALKDGNISYFKSIEEKISN